MSIYPGFRTRGYLPHLDNPNVYQFVSFRVADPELAGAGVLARPDIARVVIEGLHFYAGQRYDLVAWVVMPDHVHCLLRVHEGFTLPQILHSIKSFTANQINRILGRTGRLWDKESFDRYMRSQSQLDATIEYIHDNPVKTGLVTRQEDWLWSDLTYKNEECPLEAGGPCS